MKYHFAHLNRIDVTVGQRVQKGQVIGLMGKTGTTSSHLHYEVQKVFRGVTDYTKGLSKAKVLEYYENPYNTDWRSIIPYNNMGWDWLSDIGGGQLHPGLDLNAAYGDADLNTPIKSPTSGVVYYAADDTKAGWGKHIFIEGDEMIDQNLVDNHLYKTSDGKLLWYVEQPETASKYFPNWGNQKPITDLIPPQVITNTVTIEKPVPVEVNLLTPEEIKQVQEDWVKDHPPTVIKEVITQPMTVGTALKFLWSSIKNIKIGGSK